MPVITDKTTLRDLLTILGLEQRQKKQGKTPTRVKLMNADGLPLARTDGCTLYETGYVLYENGYGRHSVVWLPYCVNFTYYFNKLRDAEKEYLKETDDVPNETLVSSLWTTTVSLFGEERITQHMNRGLGNADVVEKTAAESDERDDEPEFEDHEGKLFVWDDETLGVDPLDAVIRRETRERMLAAMTDKQREVFVLYHKHLWTQQQIADVLWQYSTRIMGQTILGKISASCKNPDENDSADNVQKSSEKGLTVNVPVIGLDGKTKDGAMPYEILKAQLACMR